MAEQTQTEKLREDFAKLIMIAEHGVSSDKVNKVWGMLSTAEAVSYLSDANYFLKACKEAGLKFIIQHHTIPGGSYFDFEEIEI